MRKFTALILGSALTALTAGTALAASAAPAEPATKPAAVAAPAAPAAVAPAPAATAHAVASEAAKDQTPRLGYVDMVQLANDTNRGKTATAALKAKSQKLSAKIEAKQKQIEKEKAAIEAKLESYTPKERAAKAKAFQKKMEEYQKLVRSSDQEMQAMQEKLTDELFQAIKKAAIEYGKSHGYAAVLTKKEMLYLADIPAPKDLTDEIAAMLNKKADTK